MTHDWGPSKRLSISAGPARVAFTLAFTINFGGWFLDNSAAC